MKKVLCLCLVFLFCFMAVGYAADEAATTDAGAAIGNTAAEAGDETSTTPTDVAADLFGRVEDGNYVNEFIGFGFKLEDWHFYTDEEIDAMNNITKKLVTEEYAKMMDQIDMLYVMMAMAPDRTNINISMRNLGEYAPVYEMLGVDTIVESSVDASASSLTTAGCEDVKVEFIKKTVDGEEFSGLMTSYKMLGIQMSSKFIMCIRDRYLVSITVTGLEEDAIDAVFDRLYLIK